MSGRHLLAGISIVCVLPLSSAGIADNLEQASTDLCACFTDSNTISSELLDALAKVESSGDFSALIQFQNEMDSVMGSVEQCFDRLPEKYPKVNSSTELQEKVMGMAREKCPNPLMKVFMNN